MKNKIINIIRPIENGAEKEYLKEFFRFIGCFLSDWAVNDNDWDQWLRPMNEEGGVDILINYFGEDRFLTECHLNGIKRIYCYFSFDKMYGEVLDSPLSSEQTLRRMPNKAPLRRNVLNSLIVSIWRNETSALQSVLNICDSYCGNRQGDVFYYLQAKRGLRFLTMAEVLHEPDAQVSQIEYTPYIKQMIEAMWELWVKLDRYSDAYSKYTRLKAASTIREIICKLDRDDFPRLHQIEYAQKHFYTISAEDIIVKTRELTESDPQFLSAYLCLAGQCRNLPDGNQNEENCYLRILRNIPNGRPQYAFIYFRIGYYFEKRHHNQEKATEYYRLALTADPNYYQALFKLGYYAAIDGRFNEAEAILHRTLRAVFHGKSPEPDKDGSYRHWQELSQKESQYAFKIYILLAKIGINSNREYSARAYASRACLAATRFDEATLIRRASGPFEYINFMNYHHLSEPVHAIWKVLRPWSDGIVQDDYMRSAVRDRLSRWKQ